MKYRYQFAFITPVPSVIVGVIQGEVIELPIIEMEELEGRLIDKNEVVKTVSKLTAEIKESFLNIPPKISAELLACKDIVELEVKLHKEINLVLEKLSRLENRYE